MQRWRWQRKRIWSDILKWYTGAPLRGSKVRDLKAQLAAQQSIFTKPKTQSKATTIASYRVSHILAKHKKPFKALLWTKPFSRQRISFLTTLKMMKAIKEVQLSCNTSTMWCEGMAVDVEEQLRKDTDTWVLFHSNGRVDWYGGCGTILNLHQDDFWRHEPFCY